MDLKKLQKNWNKFGKDDPLWAILTDPSKRHGKWSLDEFFYTGTQEILSTMNYVESLNIQLSKKRALDFGCGVGRLTQALANHFDEVYGVDISPSMIELANTYNRYGNKCKYYLNERDDLALFDDNFFDFIYTNITLQHIEPIYSKKYIKEFVRVLSQNGVLIFQLPSEDVSKIRSLIRNFLPSLLNVYRRLKFRSMAVMEVHGIKKEEVLKLLDPLGVKVIDIQPDGNAGDSWIGFRYCVMKP